MVHCLVTEAGDEAALAEYVQRVAKVVDFRQV
jgi:hypothetical protein